MANRRGGRRTALNVLLGVLGAASEGIAVGLDVNVHVRLAMVDGLLLLVGRVRALALQPVRLAVYSINT